MKHALSVIIPSYNGAKFLKPCLDSLLADTHRSLQIVVIDNGSTDQSREVLRNYESKVLVIHLPENVGVAQAINIGVENSDGENLFITNNDIIIKKGWYRKALAFFKTYKKAAVGQAKILTKNTNKFDYAGDYISTFGFLVERARQAEDKGQFNTVEKVFSVRETAMLVRRAVFEKLNGFDSDYIFAFEETDFTWRSWLQGYETIYYPSITVWHAAGTKEKPMDYYIKNKIYEYGCRNTIASMIKNLGIKKLLFVLPIHVGCWFTLSILFLLKGEFSKSLDLLKGIVWNIIFLPKTLYKRRLVQKNRKISDEVLFTLVGVSKNPTYYLGKAVSYILGRPF